MSLPISVTHGGKTLRPGQQECDRPRELKAKEGWIVVGSQDWKERLSKRMNDESR